MIFATRIASRFSVLLFVVSACVLQVAAEEQTSVTLDHGTRVVPSSNPTHAMDFSVNFAELTQSFLNSRIDLPRRPRVTRSHRPLRRITLVGGDRFVAECLDWGTDAATFRLQSGQVIHVPISAVAELANPPGEVDLLGESFEAESSIKSDAAIRRMFDGTWAAEGRSSLRIDSSSSGYRQSLDQSVTSTRIEFSFRTAIHDLSSACGEWQLEWADKEARQLPLIVRVGSDRTVSLSGVKTDASITVVADAASVGLDAGSIRHGQTLTDAPILKRETESMSQVLKLSDGWHSFIALIEPDRIRLIVDEAILASRRTSQNSMLAINFRPADAKSKNVLWIDELQIRDLRHTEDRDRAFRESVNQDVMLIPNGDELLGRVTKVTDTVATLDAFGEQQSVPWSRIAGLFWHQPSEPIRQSTKPVNGVVSRIELQPFVDRPECEPERWIVTITSVDSMQLIAQHSLIGELKFRWSDVRRIEPQFFGQTLLVDARQFHLGNSIRSDFHRHRPDGTELRGDFVLHKIPSGQPRLSLDVAELEASSPDAPPASLKLAQLRARRLVTEVSVNDQYIGDLNQRIRFKASTKNPDRIRIDIPNGILKLGQNTFRLRQRPLTERGREFDDGEVGNVRLEFDRNENK